MYSDTGLHIKSELNNRFHHNSFTRFSCDDLTRKKIEKGSCHCGHQPGKKRKRRKKGKKGKELTSSSRGTGDVGIGKSGEPLGIPFSRVPNIRLFLIKVNNY